MKLLNSPKLSALTSRLRKLIEKHPRRLINHLIYKHWAVRKIELVSCLAHAQDTGMSFVSKPSEGDWIVAWFILLQRYDQTNNRMFQNIAHIVHDADKAEKLRLKYQDEVDQGKLHTVHCIPVSAAIHLTILEPSYREQLEKKREEAKNAQPRNLNDALEDAQEDLYHAENQTEMQQDLEQQPPPTAFRPSMRVMAIPGMPNMQAFAMKPEEFEDLVQRIQEAEKQQELPSTKTTNDQEKPN